MYSHFLLALVFSLGALAEVSVPLFENRDYRHPSLPQPLYPLKEKGIVKPPSGHRPPQVGRPGYRLPTPLGDIDYASRALVGFATKSETEEFLKPILDAVMEARTVLSNRESASEARCEAMSEVLAAIDAAKVWLNEDVAQKDKASEIVALLKRGAEGLKVQLENEIPEDIKAQPLKAQPTEIEKPT